MKSTALSHAGVDSYTKVQHDTFGHLFPTENYYEGVIRVCDTCYNRKTILDEKININASPWWYDAITNFVHELELGDGIYDVDISVTIVDHEIDEDLDEYQVEGSEFIINTLRTKKVLGLL